MKTKLLMTALAVVLSIGVASAQRGNCKNQGQRPNNNQSGICIAPGTNKSCANFVDSNNNGICDNYENGTCTGNGTGSKLRPQDGTGQRKGQRR